MLERPKGNCNAKFDIYTPYNIFDCPRVVIICTDTHSHANPPASKTPPPLLEVFRSLLLDLDWKLADATPRKLMVDSGFMGSLRRKLGWSKPFDPPLSALHPSLGNLDHVRRYIEELRAVLFPQGTGFEVVQLLADQHRNLPKEEQYVRCAETHTIEDGKMFHLVICMLRSMSTLLMRSKKISLDTAFKRLNGKWQEFGMESWELDRMKSIVGTRAFTTSQSAKAHLILFTRIFEIAHSDTGVPCTFRHIHGKGFEVWITDAHKGQALGAGMFCQKLCAQLGDVHPDLDKAFETIKNGGPKAKTWLKDKQTGSKFALPALYQPMSLIPLEIWKSAPDSSNGNEQAHRNINRDGTNLTMLGGIMRGMQYDARAMGTLELHTSQGIYDRDQTATHFRRLQRSFNRHVTVQTRVIAREALDQGLTSNSSVIPHTVEPMIESECLDSVKLYATTSDGRGPHVDSRNNTQTSCQISLFTTTPLTPTQFSLQHSESETSWFTEQMPGSTSDYRSAQDAHYLPPDSLDTYQRAAYRSFPAPYAFDPPGSRVPSTADRNISDLHVPPPDYQLPHAHSSWPFTHFNL
ncbi:hypothetical protein C8R43DRAFT_1129734 [Mycena crocata]|nr:hypothetical protein C8R43DRAFT_1129734 [Mycena crocata]